MTGWGSVFISADATQLQNGIDGVTIHDTLSDATQSRMDTVNFLQATMGIRDGQVLRFKKEMGIFTALFSYFDNIQDLELHPTRWIHHFPSVNLCS